MTDPTHDRDPVRPDRTVGRPGRSRTRTSRLRHELWPPADEPHDGFGLLLLLLVLAFIRSAFHGRVGHSLAIGLNFFMVVVALRATGMRTWRRLSWLTAIGLAGTTVARVVSDADLTVIIAAWSQALVLAAILIATVQRILRHSEVRLDTLMGAFAAYFLIAMVFSWLYIGLNRIGTPFFGVPTPDPEFPYFSVITMTTVGYGDYTPVGPFNQRLVAVEALLGQIFLASLVARMVSLFSRRRPDRPRGADSEPTGLSGAAPET